MDIVLQSCDEDFVVKFSELGLCIRRIGSPFEIEFFAVVEKM